jgi:hypothetical protein
MVGTANLIGRNDPCPCASGRKYKRCCLDADEERRRAARASGRSGGADGATRFRRAVERAMVAVRSADQQEIARWLASFGDLCLDGLDGLRFDERAFGQVANDALSGSDPPGRDELLAACLGKLVDAAFMDGLIKAVVAHGTNEALGEDARQAIALAYICLEVGKDDFSNQLARAPVEIIFETQLRQWIARRTSLDRRLDELAEAAQRGELDYQELSRRAEELAETEKETLASVDTKGLLEAADRGLKRLSDRRAAPLLAGDEIVWLLVAIWEPLVAAARSAGGDVGAKERLVQRLVEAVDPELEKTLLDRALKDVMRAPQKARQVRYERLVALQQNPLAAVGRALFTKPSPYLRHRSEARGAGRLFRLQRWTAADLREYAASLRELSEERAAERVERASALLCPGGLDFALLDKASDSGSADASQVTSAGGAAGQR